MAWASCRAFSILIKVFRIEQIDNKTRCRLYCMHFNVENKEQESSKDFKEALFSCFRLQTKCDFGCLGAVSSEICFSAFETFSAGALEGRKEKRKKFILPLLFCLLLFLLDLLQPS